jgi:hypothetical protein
MFLKVGVTIVPKKGHAVENGTPKKPEHGGVQYLLSDAQVEIGEAVVNGSDTETVPGSK